MVFENRGDHNDLINTFTDSNHEHSLGNYMMTSNATSSNNTTTQVKTENKVDQKGVVERKISDIRMK